MANEQIFVSVCIPAYNTERFIAFAVDSVLAQTHQNLELIIIDDGSVDRTYEILSAYNDPRIRLFRNLANIGAENNWNKCLSLVKGKYIKILPGDDTLYPGCIEKQIAALESPSSATLAFAYCSRDVIDAYGKYVVKARFPGSGRISRQRMVKKVVLHGMNIIGEPGAVLFRSEASRKIGYFNARLPYLIDLDYWIRLLAVGDAYALSETLCTFRLSNANWSVALGDARKTNYLEFIDGLAGRDDVGLTRMEVLVGKARTRVNEMLRKMVYGFIALRIRARALLGRKQS